MAAHKKGRLIPRSAIGRVRALKEMEDALRAKPIQAELDARPMVRQCRTWADMPEEERARLRRLYERPGKAP